MTIRQKLEQYRSLKQEIKNLERRIAKMQTRTIASVDIVKMSDAEYPYIEHNSSVIGYCTNNFSKDVVRQYKSRLARAKE
ncbi:MAG: hypothetical protein RR588_16805, partial [Solibacillus sp.]